MLGSLDVNDVIQNSLGAVVGFGAYKLGIRTKNIWRNIIVTGISVTVLIIGVWGVCGVINKAFTKEEGALNDLKYSTGSRATGTTLYSFKIGGQDLEPQFNVYSVEDKNMETYTYMLGNKELYLSLYYGITDP